MHDGIKLLREKLERMDVDELRDLIGDDTYSNATQTIAQEIVDRYDYREKK